MSLSSGQGSLGMKSTGLILLGLAALVSLPANAMRCGTRIVVEGDHAIDVLHRCGEPAYVEESVDYRYRRLAGYYGHSHASGLVPVTIETWTYNFGPHRLMRRLRFENGELRSIRTLGYGYHSSRY